MHAPIPVNGIKSFVHLTKTKNITYCIQHVYTFMFAYYVSMYINTEVMSI